ncbi:MAG: hypothetical protein ACREBG_22595 [Pyrinomonadaceae bacterium]
MTSSGVARRSDNVQFTGRILVLTEDTSLIRQQLEAVGDERERLEAEPAHRTETFPAAVAQANSTSRRLTLWLPLRLPARSSNRLNFCTSRPKNWLKPKA